MNLSLYAPFKPLDHPRLSGDVAIPRDLQRFLEERGHSVVLPASLSTEWIWRNLKNKLLLPYARNKALARCRQAAVDVWITYHSYYRSPDVIGPWCVKRLGVPYVMLAGSYATKRERDPKSAPGFKLNREALLAADLHIANKRSDRLNLARLVPEERITYIPPGIDTKRFGPNPEARAKLRAAWGVGDTAVALCAAMLRPGVKVEGVEWAIRGCAEAARAGASTTLVIAGDGPGRADLETLAKTLLPERVRFLGFVPPEQMPQIFAAGDFYVFPGISEGLGLAYLEAQCAGLPCVAFDHDGAPEVIRHGKTGYITPSFSMDEFANAIGSLAVDPALRDKMGDAARQHVRTRHDLTDNCLAMEAAIKDCVRTYRRRTA